MIDETELAGFDPGGTEQHELDPWKVRASFYEQRKLAIVLACLNQPRYRMVWDPACGVGELAGQLAPRTELLLATDSSPQSVRLTGQRCRDLPQVHVGRWELPAEPPDPFEDFDLLVLSEFVYYLSEPERAALVTMLDSVTSADAEIVSVHWRYRPHDAWLSGEDVETDLVERLTALGWRHRVQHDDKDFVLDGMERDR